MRIPTKKISHNFINPIKQNHKKYEQNKLKTLLKHTKSKQKHTNIHKTSQKSQNQYKD